MIHNLTVINHLDERLSIDLESPEKSGLMVLGIDGLGPSKATIHSTDISTTDGSYFNSARIGNRNVVISLLFLPKPTIEDTRRLTYKYFPIKKKVTLRFTTDGRICECYGYVESNEPNIFSRMQSTQISVVCTDPFLYSTGYGGDVTSVLSGIDAGFEFPFSNDSTSDDLLTVGHITNAREVNIFYEGDAHVGLTIKIVAKGEAKNVTIYDADRGLSMMIDTDKLAMITGTGLQYGDEIYISTLNGNKYVELLRFGKKTNIINCINRDASWIQLEKGLNTISYLAEYGAELLEVSVFNRTIYEGI